MSVGATPEAERLWSLADDMLTLLHSHAAERIAQTSRTEWLRARAHLTAGLGLLRYHRQAAQRLENNDRLSRLFATLDALMAQNLLDIRSIEGRRGATLVFATMCTSSGPQHLEAGRPVRQLARGRHRRGTAAGRAVRLHRRQPGAQRGRRAGRSRAGRREPPTGPRHRLGHGPHRQVLPPPGPLRTPPRSRATSRSTGPRWTPPTRSCTSATAPPSAGTSCAYPPVLGAGTDRDGKDCRAPRSPEIRFAVDQGAPRRS